MIHANYLHAWKLNPYHVEFNQLLSDWNEFWPLIDEAIDKDLRNVNTYHWVRANSEGCINLGPETKKIVETYWKKNTSRALFLLLQEELREKGYGTKGSDLRDWQRSVYFL